jgi:hypothetical protein
MIRESQIKHETLGRFFDALYKLADRIIEEFYADTPDLLTPVITLEPEPNRKAGSFVPLNSSMLENVINLNPFAHKDGFEMAATLAHEMVHHWENHVGMPTTNNVHTDFFNETMWALYGIRTAGTDGHTIGIDDRWTIWLDENQVDLHLEDYILPGADRKPPRRMFKHTCEACGASFHSRTEMSVYCKCTGGFEEFRVTR